MLDLVDHDRYLDRAGRRRVGQSDALPYSADWRWLRLRSDSPRHRNALLFRQTAPGDWQSVVTQVAAAWREPRGC
jgi:hypothetical protein